MTTHSFVPIISAEPEVVATPETQRPYNPPTVVYEASLEVRAGTPTGVIPDAVNPLDFP